MLHTVNKSAYTSSLLHSCLGSLQRGDAVLLLNDGIYGGTKTSPYADEMSALAAKNECSFYGLIEDAGKREIVSQLLPCLALIDYSDFVELAARHRHTQSWY